jgi:ectoine hydroxylase-related dioxygenase (phytanoyl-CoA dioxygenase family)
MTSFRPYRRLRPLPHVLRFSPSSSWSINHQRRPHLRYSTSRSSQLLQNYTEDLVRVEASNDEAVRMQLSDANLERALRSYHHDGIAIIQDAIDPRLLDHVHAQMLRDLPRNVDSDTVHYNHGRTSGNVTQTPPLSTTYIHEQIWANRLAIHVIEHIIGPRPQLSFATSNIILPYSTGRQAVHSDYYCAHADFPVYLEVCIFLTDVSARNGSTEIWLGTHHGYNKGDHDQPCSGWIKRDRFLERAAVRPPIQPTIKKGSLCIRDLRLWHAGMQNVTCDPRIMLGFIYSPRWFGSHMRMQLPVGARKKVMSWTHVECLADFQRDEFDYLSFRQELNLTQSINGGMKSLRGCSRVVTGPCPEHYWIGDAQ